jgi:thiol-disulfide isomerase/thioredoxin
MAMPRVNGVRTGVVAGCVAALAVVSEEPVGSKILAPGVEAPTFSLATLEGDRLALRTWCGEKLNKPYVNKDPHTVVLSFWATWCKPCQKEIPQLMKFSEAHRGEKLKVLCISVDKEGASVVQPFMKQKGYTLPVLLDPYSKTAERYGVRSVPALFVIAPDGMIQYSSMGFDEKVDLGAKLEGVYAKIVAGARVTAGKVHVAGETVTAESAGRDAGGGVRTEQGIPAKERWKAVVRVECGESPEAVAEQVGVSAAQIRAWHQDIRKAAIGLWSSQSSDSAR